MHIDVKFCIPRRFFFFFEDVDLSHFMLDSHPLWITSALFLFTGQIKFTSFDVTLKA